MISNPKASPNDPDRCQSKGWVLIPARNEQVAIAELVGQLQEFLPRVLVLADNCHDQTALMARRAGAQVIERRGSGGKGRALREGWSWLASREDCDYVVLLDGDGQHDAGEVGKFITEWRRQPVDLIVGTRAPFRLPMPLPRRWCNRWMSWLVSLKTRQRVSDSQCGFRLLGRRLFALPDWRSEHFEIETEIILRAAECGMVIGELPVATRYAQEPSRIAVVRDTLRWLRFMFCR
ncbi:MAG: glycosyltransferase family 2 protein [Verrucomicrobiales bacterium]|jgi:glycosyltransferase involved in cell wall biosynthesis|nr:glycosyltransferase family 2 protein [Verrucomicrobiales bacterium]